MPAQNFYKNFGQFLQDTDVVIQVGQEPDTKAFQAHSDILRASSAFFQSALSATWAKKEGKQIMMKKPNVSPNVFAMILEYLYSGTVNLEEQDGYDILNLLVAADELLIVQELLGYIQDHLINEKATWIENNFGLVLDTIFRNETCKQLQNYCLLQLCWRPEIVFESEDFLGYDEDVILLILEQEDLQMKEKDIWENTLRWGLAQISDLNQPVRGLTSDNFQDLCKTLRQCIPLIRFGDFSTSDIYERVFSFGDMLSNGIQPSQTYTSPCSLDHLFILLPRRPIILIDSTILHPAQAAFLPNWIDFIKQITPTLTKDQKRVCYQFKLLVRGTRDGFTPATFHKYCDDQGPNVVICRIKESGQIIGGYNPIGWRGLKSSRWQYTGESFVFSFGNAGDLNDAKISMLLPGCEAIYDDPGFGPCFGKTDLDMRIKFDEPNNCSSIRRCYTHSITDTKKFAVDEYEVFQIIRESLE
ncbi:hypothetical protein G9A89_010111 [Geosiphon pyriformis]|nr:hypothetical protein G9A89_010111 [Geosiphon pyriformis]